MKTRIRAFGIVAATTAAFTLAAGSSGWSAESDAAAAARKIVDAASQPIDEFVPPGPAIDSSSVPSGEVWYIVAAWESPLFQVIKAGLDEAFAPFGIKVQVCDTRRADPAVAATCLNQAISAKPLAIISGSVPYEIATVGFDQVVAAGIPLLYTQTRPAGDGDPHKVAYLSPDFIGMQRWLTNWVIADSNAAANTLAVSLTDHPGLVAWNKIGVLDVYPQACPNCTVTHIGTNSGQLDKLATDVTAKLVVNPSITYLQVETDTLVQPAVQAAQAAQKTPETTKVTNMDGTLEAIQSLASGQWIHATAGWNTTAFSWYIADQVVRMVSGNEANVKETFPFQRLFTAANVGELDVSLDGFRSGSWYGKADYRAGFLKLWGR